MRHIRSSTAEPSPNPNHLLEYSWYLPFPSREEERKLLGQAQAGDAAARHELLTRFHGYAKFVCKPHFVGKDYAERSDIIATAMIGLNKAIDRFDLSKPNRFKTYAHPWILKFILLHFEGRRRVNKEMGTWTQWYAEWAEEAADAAAENGDSQQAQFHCERANQLRGNVRDRGANPESDTETESEPMILEADDDKPLDESIVVESKPQCGKAAPVMDHAGGWGNGEQTADIEEGAALDTVSRDDEITAPERAETSNGEQGEHKAGSDRESWWPHSRGAASECRKIDPKSIDLTESFARLQAKLDREPQPARRTVGFKPRRRKAGPTMDQVWGNQKLVA
jgi:RNA polymerase sigma factor (sigma-70 family)